MHSEESVKLNWRRVVQNVWLRVPIDLFTGNALSPSAANDTTYSGTAILDLKTKQLIKMQRSSLYDMFRLLLSKHCKSEV